MPDVTWTPDPMLGALVKVAEGGPSGIELTLVVGGSLISGVLVSQSHWVQAVATVFREDGHEESAQMFDGVDAAIQVDGIENTDFIHLIDVKYLLGDKFVGGRTTPFRCPLSAVSGWSWGSIGVTSA